MFGAPTFEGCQFRRRLRSSPLGVEKRKTKNGFGQPFLVFRFLTPTSNETRRSFFVFGGPKKQKRKKKSPKPFFVFRFSTPSGDDLNLLDIFAPSCTSLNYDHKSQQTTIKSKHPKSPTARKPLSPQKISPILKGCIDPPHLISNSMTYHKSHRYNTPLNTLYLYSPRIILV